VKISERKFINNFETDQFFSLNIVDLKDEVVKAPPQGKSAVIVFGIFNI
jgi:hypothetical protein